MSKICFNRALEVLGTDQILIPGCEPTSAMSSDTLARFNTCECALVPLKDALAAIPGSTVRYGFNSGNGVRDRWFVLPEECVVCPCIDEPDYYAMLRDLCPEPEPEKELEDCEVIWPVDPCVPDMRDNDPDLPDTYRAEGQEPPIKDNLWASSPWYLQEKNKAEAAGETIAPPNSQKPMQPTNKESVIVIGKNGNVQSSAECSSPDQGAANLQDLMDLFG